MRRFSLLIAAALLVTLVSGDARAEPPKGWHNSLEKGVEAAAKSGKPILLITAWKRKL